MHVGLVCGTCPIPLLCGVHVEDSTAVLVEGVAGNDPEELVDVHVLEEAILRTKGGKRWKDLRIVELRAWLGILITIRIKWEPSKL
jgi:hypothetical protein